ncbi:heterokaryon incompatibility protein-domain-containing protein [Neurospora hispaniola]|uniref:Heterokaryon incompatibility protein-domain-containing protein n=1 Tax=Neurospora hispaniola TaxID=588809 RepID=A0AAJ0MSX0_9PEZI|nr:heterokaryon incompatibility protein-domain-containing protein [Neurospora hispaniola]
MERATSEPSCAPTVTMTATTAMTSNAATMPGPEDGVPTPETEFLAIEEACEVPTTKLCTHCLEYNFSRETLDPEYRPGGLDVNPVFTTFDKLVKSSTTCPLCKLILEGLECHFSERNQNSLKHRVGNDSKVFVSVWLEDETTISFFIIPPEVKYPRHPIPRLTESNLHVYQDSGNLTRLAPSPPLTPWSEPCVKRLKQWLSMCLQRHGPQCCTMRSGEEIDESLPPILPSRVIDVGSLSGSVGARLVESDGKRGYYTALSYCWGSSLKADRPYLTTTKTLEKHLSALPWDSLPKTLQDAILLTRATGVQYLWIDSLCIIQDSNADWKKEAASMGTVYAHARLVIAATTGADAEAGLFPSQTCIHRPGETSSALYFSKLPKESGSPQHNLPLFTRGWAFQEWVLARRIVFWTQDRMCWHCAEGCAGDDSKNVWTSSGLFGRYNTWKEIVTRYSGREFTYPTDKLMAISGIANEIHKKRPEDKGCFSSDRGKNQDGGFWRP